MVRRGPSGLSGRVARRASVSDLFATPTVIPGLDTALEESDPTITFDGTTLYFSLLHAPDSLGDADIYYATRSCL